MRLIPLIALLLAAAPALAGEPFGFKGVTLGSADTAIRQDPRFECRKVDTPSADQICNLRSDQQETIAGVPVASLYYFFDRARLTRIVIGLDSANFQQVADALIARHGQPREINETVKNFKGVSFDDRVLLWTQGDTAIRFQRYAGKVDRSLLQIFDEKAAERIRQRKETVLQPDRDL
jgi:hypothetical protein